MEAKGEIPKRWLLKKGMGNASERLARSKSRAKDKSFQPRNNFRLLRVFYEENSFEMLKRGGGNASLNYGVI